MMVNYKLRNLEKVQDFLKSLPYGTMKVGLAAFVEYVIGNEQHGLRHSEPYKYVSRASAYGSVSTDGAPIGYFSWKQFRYVAAITKGFTMRGSHRTGASADGWQYVEVTPYSYKITNPEPGAYWTRDDYGQAAQPARVGWRKVSEVITDNMKGAMRHATAAINEYLKAKAR